MFFTQAKPALNRKSRGIGDDNIDDLIAEINAIPNLKELDLYRNNIGGKGLEKLAAALPLTLVFLKLGYNDLEDGDLECLTPVVKQGALKRIDLRINYCITNKSLPTIMEWRIHHDVDVNTSHTLIDTSSLEQTTQARVDITQRSLGSISTQTAQLRI